MSNSFVAPTVEDLPVQYTFCATLKVNKLDINWFPGM